MKDYIQIGIEKCVRETAILSFGGSAGQQCVPSSYLENFAPPASQGKTDGNNTSHLRIATPCKELAGRR